MFKCKVIHPSTFNGGFPQSNALINQISWFYISSGRDMVSRVVQSLTSQIDEDSAPPVSITVFKMKHEINEYLRRKEMHRVLSKLPVKFIGMLCYFFLSFLHNSCFSLLYRFGTERYFSEYVFFSYFRQHVREILLFLVVYFPCYNECTKQTNIRICNNR